jgi:hypothetical protein
VIDTGVPPRPGPWRWLRYAFGARLPEHYRPWIFHDATVSTWWLRQLARTTAQALPWAIVAGVLLGVFSQVWIAVAAPLVGLLVSAGYSLTIAAESVEARLVKHGFEPESGRDARRKLKVR